MGNGISRFAAVRIVTAAGVTAMLLMPWPAQAQSGHCRAPEDADQAHWPDLCMRCAADADMPAYYLTMQRDQLAETRNGRVWLPPAESWYSEPSPRAVHSMASPYPDGGYAPVQWGELDAETGLAICERTLGDDSWSRYTWIAYGRLLHSRGDLAAAADAFETAFDDRKGPRSNAVVATYLARMVEMGWGTEKDPERAIGLYTLAAEEARTGPAGDDQFWPGHSRAMHNLASLHFWGIGTERDIAKAAELWRQAALLWQPHSMANLAWLYHHSGREADREKAAALYLEALRLLSLRDLAPDLLAGNENRFGTFSLAPDVSLDWLRGVARDGQREALFTLGYLHHSGKLGAADLDTALDYYGRAIRAYGLSPEYSPGPAHVDAHGQAPRPPGAAWSLDGDDVETGEKAKDPFALMFAGAALEGAARSGAGGQSLLQRAVHAYIRSERPNARARAANLPSPVTLKLDIAAEFYRPAAQRGNPSAQYDLGIVLLGLGDERAGADWIGKSLDAVRHDFLHPDMRPLFVGSIALLSQADVDASLDAIFNTEEAQRRAVFRGEQALLEEMRRARQIAYDSYKQALAAEQRARKERRKRALAAVIRALAEAAARSGGPVGPSGGSNDLGGRKLFNDATMEGLMMKP